MKEEIIAQAASQITTPLWLVLTLLGLLLTLVLAFIPYIIFQVKQMFMITRSMTVLLEHVSATRNHNGKVLNYQTEMKIKTDQYTNSIAMMISNNRAILSLLEQGKITSSNQTKLIINNTEAMTNIRVTLAEIKKK